MKRQPPILIELQAVDLTLQLAGRDRPSGYRCLLGDKRSLPELQPERIEHAIEVARLVTLLSPDVTRRTICLAMATDRGEPVHDRRTIARLLRISESSVTRHIRDGLRQVETGMRDLSTKLERHEHSENCALDV